MPAGRRRMDSGGVIAGNLATVSVKKNKDLKEENEILKTVAA